MNKNLLIALALPLLTCVVAAATPSPAPSPSDSLESKPGDIQDVKLFVQDVPNQQDAFGLPLSGPLTQPKAAPTTSVPAAPVITHQMVVNALQVQMINPPDSILINGRFIQTGSRLQVTYKNTHNLITLESVTPTLVTFTWDDGSRASIQVRTPNYAQVLTDTPTDTDLMSSSPPINLDAKPAPSTAPHNPNQQNRH